MRSFVLSVLLALPLFGACSKQEKSTTPPPAATPAPAAPAEAPPQGIAVGEPHPADPNAAPRPASVSDADVALADKLIATLLKFTASVEKAGTNCQAVADAIRAIAPELKELTAESMKMDERLSKDAAAQEWFKKTYEPKLAEPMGKLSSNACMNDPAVSSAMQSLGS